MDSQVSRCKSRESKLENHNFPILHSSLGVGNSILRRSKTRVELTLFLFGLPRLRAKKSVLILRGKHFDLLNLCEKRKTFASSTADLKAPRRQVLRKSNRAHDNFFEARCLCVKKESAAADPQFDGSELLWSNKMDTSRDHRGEREWVAHGLFELAWCIFCLLLFDIHLRFVGFLR